MAIENIAELRGKVVLLENIENPVLKRVLSYRINKDRFHFAAEINYNDGHTEKYEENHTDDHNDDHTDRSPGYNDNGSIHPDYSEAAPYVEHIDTGHSEAVNYGYNKHTDSQE
jgi:hypothetical protein